MKQWNSLTHHVTSHQRTVTIIMLQERNKTSRHWGNLLWRDIYQVNRVWTNNRIICILTTLYGVTNECTIIIQWCITLSDNLVFFFFCCQEYNILVIHINLRVMYTTIRCHDETKIINLSIHTKRRYQTNVRSFRRLNWTKTTIVSIVNVTNLKTCTLSWKSTRT